MHERYAVTSLGFIQIRSGDEYRQTVGREMSESVPEFSTRYWIDTGRRLIQQQGARLGDERAGERELLLHSAAQLTCEPVRETVHIKHLEIAVSSLLDFFVRDEIGRASCRERV